MQTLSKIAVGGSLLVAIAAVGVPQASAQQQLVGDANAQPVTLTLQGTTGSGEASLAPTGTGVDATIEVGEMPASSQWTVFLIGGTCSAPGDVMATLGDIQASADGAGTVRSSITASLPELLANPATIQVHPQGDAPTEAALCAELPAGGAAIPAP